MSVYLKRILCIACVYARGDKVMNEQEVIEALQAGKKLVCDIYNIYYKLVNNIVEVYCKHEVKPLARHYLDDFIIIYEKYLTNLREESNLLISEAFEALKQGKKLRRIEWSTYELICVENNNEVVKYTKGLSISPIFLTKLDDFLDNFYPDVLFEIVEDEALHECKESTRACVNEPPQKCSKCHCYDDYNSKGKDGKWYCYKHCY